MKIVVGITAPLSVVLLEGQLEFFTKKSNEVYLLAPKNKETIKFCKDEGATLLPVSIKREISLFHDILSLFVILKHIYSVQPDVVNVGTPKMGLLGTFSSWILRVPKRIYTCRGFRYEHEAGFKKSLLKYTEMASGYFSHTVICISQSVRKKGIEDKVFKETKTHIIGRGSSNGIDLKQFNPNSQNEENVELLKKKHSISGKFIYGFVGRIVDRKGINELYKSFKEVHSKYPDTHLLIVGKANLEQVRNPNLMEELRNDSSVSLSGYVNNVPEYLKLFDVFVLPAWWEGFGNTLIQAAAMGIPIISCNVTGCRDAVNDGFNGILIEPNNNEELVKTMIEMYINNELRSSLGANGIKWAENFRSEIIWTGLEKIYKN